MIEKFADSSFADAMSRRADVKFELGREQLADEKVDEAIATWNSILTELEDYRLADNVMYEVTFALRGQKKHDQAKGEYYSVGFKAC